MHLFRQICFGIGVAGLIALAVGVAIGNPLLWRSAAVVAGVALAIGFGSVPALRPYQFTAWIVAGVVAAMIYPSVLPASRAYKPSRQDAHSAHHANRDVRNGHANAV